MPAQILQQLPAALLSPEQVQQQQKTNSSLDQTTAQGGAASQTDPQHLQQLQQQVSAAAAGHQLTVGGTSISTSSNTAGTPLNILPYGSTLHYPGCSCPGGWQRGSRVADQVDKLVAKAHGLYQQGLIAPQRKLRVCYMLPHHNITGGMKCLVEHVRLLRARGHYTIAVHR